MISLFQEKVQNHLHQIIRLGTNHMDKDYEDFEYRMQVCILSKMDEFSLVTSRSGKSFRLVDILTVFQQEGDRIIFVLPQEKSPSSSINRSLTVFTLHGRKLCFSTPDYYTGLQIFFSRYEAVPSNFETQVLFLADLSVRFMSPHLGFMACPVGKKSGGYTAPEFFLEALDFFIEKEQQNRTQQRERSGSEDLSRSMERLLEKTEKIEKMLTTHSSSPSSSVCFKIGKNGEFLAL